MSASEWRGEMAFRILKTVSLTGLITEDERVLLKAFKTGFVSANFPNDFTPYSNPVLKEAFEKGCQTGKQLGVWSELDLIAWEMELVATRNTRIGKWATWKTRPETLVT
jgi:hypothetical protein